MKSSLRWLVVPALLLLAFSAQARAQSIEWWKDEQFQKDLGLTAEQSTRIDGVFQSTLPLLRQHKEELDKREAELSKLIEAEADEATVSKQIDRVEATRAHLNKIRTLMHLHMRQVLTPDQRVKFKALAEQWQREHRRPRPNETHDRSER